MTNFKQTMELLLSRKKLDGRLVEKQLSIFYCFIKNNKLIGDNITEKAYLIYNELFDVPKCKICTKNASFINLKNGYSNTCCNKNCKNKWVQLCKENSTLKKYGVKNVYQIPEVIEKIKNTNIDRYGSTTFIHSKVGTQVVKNSMLEKYNVENPMQSNEIKSKMIDNSLKKYGTKWSLGSKNSQDKIKETWGNRGFKRNSSTTEWLINIKSTNQKKYGVDFPAQSSVIYDKMLSSMYNRKDYKLPSGKIVQIQGYENKTLDIFLQQYNEDDLIIGAKNIYECIGKITYLDESLNKERVYIPDMYIKSTNTIIETKSDRTFRTHKLKNLNKKHACLAKGLNFNFAIHLNEIMYDYDEVNDKYKLLNL